MEKTAAFNNAVLELNERIRIITAIAPAFKSPNAIEEIIKTKFNEQKGL